MSRPSTLYVKAAHPKRPVTIAEMQPLYDRVAKRYASKIYADKPHEVPNTSYYRTLIRDKDLVEVKRPAKASKDKGAS